MNKKKVLRYGRWLIGILILVFVFKQIDLAKLKEYLLRSNFWLIGLGLLHSPLLIIIGSMRWQYILAQYFKPKLPTKTAIEHYWSGVAIGFFTPASLGLDAYRVILGARIYGNYTINAVSIIIEKIIALVTCASLFAVLYPMVPVALNSQLMVVLYIAYFILLCFTMLLFFSGSILKSKAIMHLLSKCDKYGTKILNRISKKYAFQREKITIDNFLKDIIRPMSLLKVLLIGLFTMGIQFVSSLKSQIFFSAIGYDLPFIVNLFVAPTIYFIFMLPISFGSLGIREGVYIILYGLFGIPPEIAIIISFYNLIGMALNNLIGGIIMIFARKDKNSELVGVEKNLKMFMKKGAGN